MEEKRWQILKEIQSLNILYWKEKKLWDEKMIKKIWTKQRKNENTDENIKNSMKRIKYEMKRWKN